MATGYTWAVVKGSVSFPVFARLCARAFGPLVTLRDEPLDAPLPDVIEPRTAGFDARIAELTADLARVEAMSADECAAAQERERETAAREAARYRERQELGNAHVAAMREQVEKWTPPTPEHDGLKSFMLQQLDVSVAPLYEFTPPPDLPPEEWRDARKAVIMDSLSRTRRQRVDEVDRAAGATRWLRALRAALDASPASP